MKLFFSTELAPCPYLADRLERRLVTMIDGPDPDRLHDRLMQAGFRRSQELAYRPACPGCTACVPVRIPVVDFRLTRTWRRILRQNADLSAAERHPVATEEQFTLFRRYLAGRHGASGMVDMTWSDFCAMVNDSPIESRLVEWRRPDGSLIAASLTDRGSSGLSGVYKFFDPNSAKRSLGSLVILWHVQRALELRLPYVYLGYWIADSPTMAYKARFQPLERLTPNGWEAMVAPAPTEAPASRTARSAPLGQERSGRSR